MGNREILRERGLGKATLLEIEIDFFVATIIDTLHTKFGTNKLYLLVVEIKTNFDRV